MARCSEVSRGRLGATALVIGLAFSSSLTGCDRNEDPVAGGVVAPKGPEDARVLQNDFLGLIEDARKKDAAAIMARLEKYLLTREELVVLFGPTAGEAAWAGYGGDIASKLRAEAPQLIIDRVAEGYTEVHVGGVGPAYPAATTPGDQRMLDALKKKRLMYSVWLRKPGEFLGLRFNGFIFHEGRWRALLKTYDHLPVPEPMPVAPPSVLPTAEARGEAPAGDADRGEAPAGDADRGEAPAGDADRGEAPGSVPESAPRSDPAAP